MSFGRYSIFLKPVIYHREHTTLVLILIIPWEFLEGSSRILKLQDPFKFNSRSWSNSLYFPCCKILSSFVQDPHFVSLHFPCYKIFQGQTGSCSRFCQAPAQIILLTDISGSCQDLFMILFKFLTGIIKRIISRFSQVFIKIHLTNLFQNPFKSRI